MNGKNILDKAKQTLKKIFREPKKDIPLWTPSSEEELVACLKKTPVSVLSMKKKVKIGEIMGLSSRLAKDLMVEDYPTVMSSEFLGPLMLDRLYKSGWVDFPVMDLEGKVLGRLHSTSLMSLEIAATDHAKKYMDERIGEIAENAKLSEVVDEILKSGATLLVVRDANKNMVGVITLGNLLKILV
jgi:predicted transcriptional regulator